MPLNWSSSPNVRIPYTCLSPQRALSKMTRSLPYLKPVGLWTFVTPWHGLQCLPHVAPSPCSSAPPPCSPSVQAETPLPDIHHMQTHLHLRAFVHQMPVPGMSETTTCEALLDPPSSRLSVNQTKKSLAQELASCVQWPKSIPLPVFINKFSSEKNHAHCLCIVCGCFLITIQSSRSSLVFKFTFTTS